MGPLTDKDKAVEYDRIAGYLRDNGWSVLKIWRHPVDGTLHESWYRGDPHSQHDLLSAYRVECYKDAPKQGERMARNLAGLGRVIDEKRAPELLNRLRDKSLTRPCANCGHVEGAHWYISGGHAGPLGFDGCCGDREGDPHCDCPDFRAGENT